MTELVPEPLTKAAFAPFGTVIELDGAETFMINEGTTQRFHALASLDVQADEGEGILSVFRASAHTFPIELSMMECHPLGSQAFVPLNQDAPWLVVAAPGPLPTAETCRAFIARGDQGVQYARGVWHHPLLSLTDNADFLVADRKGPGENLQEVAFDGAPAVIRLDAFSRSLEGTS